MVALLISQSEGKGVIVNRIVRFSATGIISTVDFSSYNLTTGRGRTTGSDIARMTSMNGSGGSMWYPDDL